MIRRHFLLISSAALALPLQSAMAQEEVCLTGVEGVDVESNEAIGFVHYHQLIISVSDIVKPPKEGVLIKASRVDQGSYDIKGLEAFAKTTGSDIKALSVHDHDVFISYEELTRIAAGEKNVEISVFARDKKTYVHNFLVTAPRSVLAIIEKEIKK